MIRKSIFTAILAISLMGCDEDFRQGSCEEGFYEQADGNGGFLCAPINEKGAADKSMITIDNVNDTD